MCSFKKMKIISGENFMNIIKNIASNIHIIYCSKKKNPADIKIYLHTSKTIVDRKVHFLKIVILNIDYFLIFLIINYIMPKRDKTYKVKAKNELTNTLSVLSHIK